MSKIETKNKSNFLERIETKELISIRSKENSSKSMIENNTTKTHNTTLIQ